MKKLTFVIFAAILLGSLSITQGQSKFLTGKFSADGNTNGYNLDENSGDRSLSIEVNFLDPFESRPEVVVAVSNLDADKASNTRFRVEASNVSRDGFIIKITTWGDSKIYGIGGSWVAHAK